MRGIWLEDSTTYDNVMIWAACTTTFFSFCHAGEVTVEADGQYDPSIHLSVRDLAVENTESPSIIDGIQIFDNDG